MEESIKIAKLEIENVKRVKAVKIEPTKNGLTVIGGKNRQGKTSVLDAIQWALGGNKMKPDEPERKGSVTPPAIDIVLSNGLRVERKGKNSDLKVTDPSGTKAGQKLLDSFVEEFALDLPKFMNQTSKDKAKTMLNLLGLQDKIMELEQAETMKYNERQAQGRIRDQKKKYAAELPYYPDAPKQPILATDIIKQQQEILVRNGENQRKRERLNEIKREKDKVFDETKRLEAQIKDLQEKFNEKKKDYEKLSKDEEIALKTTLDLHDESTAELEESLRNIEKINVQVRSNLSKDKAEEEAEQMEEIYQGLTSEIELIRSEKASLLDGAKLPLDGLTVKDGELVYNGFTWDNLSGADQLIVATSIVRKLNPKCGFVLLDKLEQMDTDTLNDFGKWLESEGLQAIATRVSSGDECQIIIEDGYAVKNETLTKDPEQINETATTATWAPGRY